MDSSKPTTALKSIVKNPAFILAKGIQRIRVLHRLSVKKSSKDKIKSCEFYLNERKHNRKIVPATQFPVNKSKLNDSISSATLRSDSPPGIETIKNQCKSSIEFPDYTLNSLFGPYIKKFLAKKVKPKPISPIPQTENFYLSQSHFKTKLKAAINSVNNEKIYRSRSESIFNKLQNSISSELEKSVTVQKTLDAQIDQVKSLKKITENFKKFKPTKFELKVLGGPRVSYEVEKLAAINFKAKNSTSAAPLFKNGIGKNTTSKYQILYRQFNNAN